MSKDKFLCMACAAVALLTVSISPSFAQSSAPSSYKEVLFNPDAAEPDVNKIVPLKRLVDKGLKLYYMGERSSLHGWVAFKDRGIQMLYVTPDYKTVLVGALLTGSGRNVTREQLAYVFEKYPFIREAITVAGKEVIAIKDAGKKGGVTSVTAAPEVNKADHEKDMLPTATISPGEQLLQDLKAAGGVDLGTNLRSKIYMIAAPSCPVCKATWKELYGSIKSNDVSVRLIPVYNNVVAAEVNQAAQLLTAKDPLKTWNSFVNGDKKALAGEGSDLAVRAVSANLKIVSKWNIQGYPYLVYRGKDGRIKIVQGKPERMAAVLLDLRK